MLFRILWTLNQATVCFSWWAQPHSKRNKSEVTQTKLNYGRSTFRPMYTKKFMKCVQYLNLCRLLLRYIFVLLLSQSYLRPLQNCILRIAGANFWKCLSHFNIDPLSFFSPLSVWEKEVRIRPDVFTDPYCRLPDYIGGNAFLGNVSTYVPLSARCHNRRPYLWHCCFI